MKGLKNCILILLLLPAFILPDISLLFKKAENKGKEHVIDNIDFIYVINLDERPEKFQDVVQKLAPYNIIPYRFSAVNGWKLPIESMNLVGVRITPGMDTKIEGNRLTENSFTLSSTFESLEGKYLEGKLQYDKQLAVGERYVAHGVTFGSIGIVLSHLSVLQDALDANYQRIWVMEDDIKVIQSPHILSNLISELDTLVGKDGWDILFTDTETIDHFHKRIPCKGYAKRPNYTPSNPHIFLVDKPISQNLRRIGARYGAYSMIVNRTGMKKLLNFIKQFQVFLPIDMEYTLPEGMKLFTVRDDVVSTEPNAITDNASPYYLHKP